MNVIGYVSEPSNQDSGESMFAQSERVRRWVARNGYQLIAICQDTAGTRPNLDGFRTLMSIATRGQADLVLLPGLDALSPDKVVQELMLMKLRSRGLAVASTEESDHEHLSEPTVDPARMLIRDVLHRSEAFTSVIEPVDTTPILRVAPPVEADERAQPETDVVIEFVDAPGSAATAS